MRFSRRVWLWVLSVLSGGLGAWAADLIPNRDCLECHADKTLTTTNAHGVAVSLYVEEARLANSVHRTNWCASCHHDLTKGHPDDSARAKPVDCAACHPRQSESYGASAHGLALKAGKPGVAGCVDCHGGHEVMNPASPASPLHYSRLAVTCGECHPDIAKEVQESVHGRATAKGSREAATCTDCHSEHQIEPLKTVSRLKVAADLCGKCHASERINTKYRLPAKQVKSFFESYHGLAVRYGSTQAANCASCHGVHNILPSSNPRSSIHQDHLVATCGKCHPGATEGFAFGKVHVDDATDSAIGARISRWVRRVYIGLIIGVVAVLALHNLLAWGKHLVAAYRSPERSVLRLERALRVQHMVLLVSFTALAITGFALKYPDSWIAWLLGSNETVRRWLHRGAGLALLGLGAWHVFFVAATAQGRQLLRDFWPSRRDLRDLGAFWRYLRSGSGSRPHFGRFSYREKLEYWSVVWGTLIMGITGLMIWFKLGVTHWLPRWAVDVALTVHFYEAILACLAILVWHIYFVMFDPEVYPLNWAWWDGRAAAHWIQTEHGAEGEADSVPATAVQSVVPGATSPPAAAATEPPDSPPKAAA